MTKIIEPGDVLVLGEGLCRVTRVTGARYYVAGDVGSHGIESLQLPTAFGTERTGFFLEKGRSALRAVAAADVPALRRAAELHEGQVRELEERLGEVRSRYARELNRLTTEVKA